MDFRKQLNETQFAAASAVNGPLLILAGAGSGKTRVITYRTANLIRNHNVPPFCIMAVTFTNKAAAEMRKRVIDLIGPAGEQVFIRTFHASCVYILRRYGKHIGIPSNFTIYDSKDQESVIKEILLDMKIDPKKQKPSAIVSKISEIKDKAELDSRDNSLFFPDSYSFNFAELYESYNEKLHSRNALDFNDLLIKTVVLLKNSPDSLEDLQNKWKYIMVDEYQDTNKAQYLITKMLADKYKNICVVGDDDQSIYSWRGANIRNILDFEKDYPNALVVKLEHNYRSTAPILNAAHSVIRNNIERKDKQLISTRGDGEKPVYCSANNEYGEAEFVINKIQSIKHDEGLNNSDFAVFYRTNAQSRIFEDYLRKNDINYRIVGGLKFYDRKEIKDIVSYLKLIVNPFDTISLFRSINNPPRGIGAKTIEKIRDAAYEEQISEWEVIDKEIQFGGKIPAGLVKFRSIMLSFFVKHSYVPEKLKLTDFVRDVISDSGYKRSLEEENTPESKTRLENIDEFFNSIFEYENANPESTLEEFLQEISLLTSEENPLDDENTADPDNCVTLMTVHNAKGLEYPVVFLTGMEEGTFPHFNSSDNEEGIEEERRLAYVGITRAMNILFITSAEFRRSYSGISYKEKSRFIDEIDPSFLNHQVYSESNSSSQIYGGSFAGTNTVFRRTESTAGFSAGSASAEAKDFFNKINSGTGDSGKKENSSSSFSIRDRVNHPKYGNGYILTIEGTGDNVKLTINFNTVGVKSFLEKYTPLQKI
ncbi:MAG: UvrD-helicase domain-containing protein [Spirochaetes bacterium]|nr:UvrD-helicase domain-containing protein [Spirochaetota bacterium]